MALYIPSRLVGTSISTPPVLSLSQRPASLFRRISEATLFNCMSCRQNFKYQKRPTAQSVQFSLRPFFSWILSGRRDFSFLSSHAFQQNLSNSDREAQQQRLRSHTLFCASNTTAIPMIRGHGKRTHFAFVLLLTFLIWWTEASSSGTSVTKASGPPSFFIRDKRDGLCLGGEVFKRCGIDTLWFVEGKAGAYQLHRRLVDEVDLELCLGKTYCHLEDSPARLSNCNHCGTQKWNILGDEEDGECSMCCSIRIELTKIAR